MPDFCANKNAQPTGEHEVHNLDAGCFNLPNPANQRALGSHSDCHGAVAAARTFYADVDGCAWCAPACHAK